MLSDFCVDSNRMVSYSEHDVIQSILDYSDIKYNHDPILVKIRVSILFFVEQTVYLYFVELIIYAYIATPLLRLHRTDRSTM